MHLLENRKLLTDVAFRDKEPLPKIFVLSYGPNTEEKMKQLNSLWKALNIDEKNRISAIRENYIESCTKELAVDIEGRGQNPFKFKCEKLAEYVVNDVLERSIMEGFDIVWDISGICLQWVVKVMNLVRSRGYLIFSLEPKQIVEGKVFKPYKKKSEFFSEIVDVTFRYNVTFEREAALFNIMEKEYLCISGFDNFEGTLRNTNEPFLLESYYKLKRLKGTFSAKFENYLSTLPSSLSQ